MSEDNIDNSSTNESNAYISHNIIAYGQNYENYNRKYANNNLEKNSKIISEYFGCNIDYFIKYCDNNKLFLCLGCNYYTEYKRHIEQFYNDIETLSNYNNIKCDISELYKKSTNVKFYKYDIDNITFNSIYNNDCKELDIIYLHVDKIIPFCYMMSFSKVSYGIIYPISKIVGKEDDKIIDLLYSQILPEIYNLLDIKIGQNCKPNKVTSMR